MPGALNITGLPKTEDYFLGRGTIYLSDIDSTTGLPIGGWRDVGNVPSFQISLEVESLEHKSSRAGLQVVDKKVTLSQKATVTFSFDELNADNLALFLSGQSTLYTNPAYNNAGGSAIGLATAGNWSRGRWYLMYTSIGGGRLYDLDPAGTLVVKSGTNTLTLNTDYTVDYKLGRIFIINKTSGNVGTPASENLTYEYTSAGTPAEAQFVSEVRGLTATSVTVALQFRAENATDDEDISEVHIHQITLASDGEMALIGDEWAVGSITGVVERNALASATSPSMTIRTP